MGMDIAAPTLVLYFLRQPVPPDIKLIFSLSAKADKVKHLQPEGHLEFSYHAEIPSRVQVGHIWTKIAMFFFLSFVFSLLYNNINTLYTRSVLFT